MSGVYFAAATGMLAQQARLDAVANNIANLATTGFKSGRVDLADLPAEAVSVSGPEAPIGRGVEVAGISRSLVMGPLQQTGNPLDLAILGEDAFFQVRTPAGVAFTRAGNLTVSSDGQIVYGDGQPIEPPIQLPQGATVDQVTTSGEIVAILPNSPAPAVVGQLRLARFPNPEGLESLGQNLLRPSAASGPAQIGSPGADGFPQLASGMIEASNVDLAEQATRMIEAQRAYSMNLRSLQTLDEMVGQAIQLRT